MKVIVVYLSQRPLMPSSIDSRHDLLKEETRQNYLSSQNVPGCKYLSNVEN